MAHYGCGSQPLPAVGRKLQLPPTAAQQRQQHHHLQQHRAVLRRASAADGKPAPQDSDEAVRKAEEVNAKLLADRAFPKRGLFSIADPNAEVSVAVCMLVGRWVCRLRQLCMQPNECTGTVGGTTACHRRASPVHARQPPIAAAATLAPRTLCPAPARHTRHICHHHHDHMTHNAGLLQGRGDV
jgi:hypothetical protein